METNNNNMTELEQMREQMSIFKSQLDKQQIINEQLVRNTMGNKMSWIKKFIWAEIILVPIILHASEGLSWWLFAFLAIGLIADTTGDFIINRIPKGQMLSGDLVETSQRLIKMKKQRTSWFIAGSIFLTIWIVWFIIEIVMKLNVIGCNEPSHNLVVTIMVTALIIGCLIGFLVAWLIFRKMQKTNNQIIEQINQVTQED